MFDAGTTLSWRSHHRTAGMSDQENETVSQDFRQDYATLLLDDDADWATARTSYRRQVNLCHPDRYAQRPRERAHAQQQFIQITRAFDSLRAFYRTNSRLPFEPIRRDQTSSPGADARPAAPRPDADEARDMSDTIDRPSEEALLDAGILNLRKGSPARDAGMRGRRLIWPALGGLVVLGTLGLFVVLDRSARQATLDEGRAVLRETTPSVFMPSATEVKRQSSRGVFVERDDRGRIGEQLMEDIFK